MTEQEEGGGMEAEEKKLLVRRIKRERQVLVRVSGSDGIVNHSLR